MAPTSPPVPEGYVLIGSLGKTFKLEGGLRFHGLGPAEQAAIVDLKQVYVPALGFVAVKRVLAMPRQTVVYLAGVLSVEAAKRLVNEPVYAPRAELPDGVYAGLLVGMPVWLNGQPFGTVSAVDEAGGQYLLAVVADGKEYLVPLAAPYVVIGDVVDIRDPPEGLLEP